MLEVAAAAALGGVEQEATEGLETRLRFAGFTSLALFLRLEFLHAQINCMLYSLGIHSGPLHHITHLVLSKCVVKPPPVI